MRQQFKDLDTWRGKLTATCLCLAPPAAMVAVFVVGGVTSNTFVVDAHALAAPRQDAVFDELAENVPDQPGADGSLPTQERSSVQVPITGTTDGTVKPIPGGFGDTSGIPGTVLAAYQKAARDLALSMPGCHITWPLLAGIGKVESAHASGGKVDANGNTRGKILGPVLNGGPGMAAISDTDQGAYDGNSSWDRAVGPMQFIPGTWKVFGADGNGDGVKDPHNVFDAARAAGDYLCSGGANLADPEGLVQAVLRYNHSMEYVSTVLRWMQTYSKDTVSIPDKPGTIDIPDDDGNAKDPESEPTSPPSTPTTPATPATTAPPTTPTSSPTSAPTSAPTSQSPTPTLTPTPSPSKPTRPPLSPPPSTSTNSPDTPSETPDPTTPPTEDPSDPTTSPTGGPSDPTTSPTSPTTSPTSPTPTEDDPTQSPDCTTPETTAPTSSPTVAPTPDQTCTPASDDEAASPEAAPNPVG